MSYIFPYASALGHCRRQMHGLCEPRADMLRSSLCSCDSLQIINCCKNDADWFQRLRSRRPGLNYTQFLWTYYWINLTRNQGSVSQIGLRTPGTLLLLTFLKLLMNLPGPLCQWEQSKVLNVCLNALFVFPVSLCHTSRCWEQKARPHVVLATVAPWQQAEQCQAKSLHRLCHQHWRGLLYV